jgi:hypothetical protein
MILSTETHPFGDFKANRSKRGALPPTIVLSMYQADSVAKILGSLGYLTAIGADPTPSQSRPFEM